jgi:uncharacterized membrane protein
MKFSGLHLHMALVVALICVIVYVFYISKDILTIDTEVRNLKKQVEAVQRAIQQPAQAPVAPAPPVAPLAPVFFPPSTQEVPLTNASPPSPPSSVSDEASDADEVTSEVESERIRGMMTQIQTSLGESPEATGTTDATIDDSPEPSTSFTLAELKTLCKEKGLSVKGTKDQLLERLSQATA